MSNFFMNWRDEKRTLNNFRFSNNSRHSGDSAVSPQSDGSDGCQHECLPLVDNDALWLKTSSAVVSSGAASRRSKSATTANIKTMSDEAFSQVIKNHHSRVLSQLRLDHDDFVSPTGSSPSPTATGDRDSGIQDVSSSSSKSRKPAELEKKSSLSKIKAMKFGLGGGGSKSQKSIQIPTNNNNTVMKRCESLDLLKHHQLQEQQRQQQLQQQQPPQPQESSIKSQLRKYSEVFNRKLKLPSSSQQKVDLRDDLGDSDGVPDDESFNTLEPSRRLRRSRITSKWENMRFDDDVTDENVAGSQ